MCDLSPLSCSSDVIVYKSMGCINSDLISNLLVSAVIISSWNHPWCHEMKTLYSRGFHVPLIVAWTRVTSELRFAVKSPWFIHFSRPTCMYVLVMRRKISNVLGVIGTLLFGSTMAPRRSIAFWNSTGTWSCAPCKQFGVLDQWHDGHGWAARWSGTLLIRPVEPNTNRISRDWLTMWVYKLFTGEVNLNTANNSTQTKLDWSNICYLSVFFHKYAILTTWMICPSWPI